MLLIMLLAECQDKKHIHLLYHSNLNKRFLKSRIKQRIKINKALEKCTSFIQWH